MLAGLPPFSADAISSALMYGDAGSNNSFAESNAGVFGGGQHWGPPEFYHQQQQGQQQHQSQQQQQQHQNFSQWASGTLTDDPNSVWCIPQPRQQQQPMPEALSTHLQQTNASAAVGWGGQAIGETRNKVLFDQILCFGHVIFASLNLSNPPPPPQKKKKKKILTLPHFFAFV